MTEVSFPLPDTKHTATAFYKLGKRRALAISVIGGGMVVTVDDNGVCTYCSMRAGAMARYPQRYKSCEGVSRRQEAQLGDHARVPADHARSGLRSE